MIEKISLNKLSDEEVLKIIYNEFMRIKPRNFIVFQEESCLPTIITIKKRFKLRYTEILTLSGVPEEYIHIKSDEFYLDLLRQLSQKLGHTPTINELKKEGYEQAVYRYRFGSYNNALKAAGLTQNRCNFRKNVKITKKQVISDYKELSAVMGKPASQNDFKKYIKYPFHLAVKKFGGFNAIREEAGFPADNRGGNNKRYCKEVILNMLVEEYIRNGGPIMTKELHSKGGYPNICTLLYLFKTTKISDVWLEVAAKVNEKLMKNELPGVKDKRKEAGDRGEKNISHNLKFLPEGYIVYNGIKIYSEVYGEEQEYDHLVIGPNGVFCIETKYVYGDVTINSNGSWDVTSYDVSRTMDNPVQQVMRHSNLIKSILPEGIPLLSIIAMGNRKTRVYNKVGCQYPIVGVDTILPYIQEYESAAKLSEMEVRKIDKLLKRVIIANKKVSI